MKRTIYITVTLMLILRLDATAIAQNTQAVSSINCNAKPDMCVTVDYDKFEDRTYARTIPFYVETGRFWNTLSLGAIYASPGKNITRPSEATFVFIVMYSDIHGGDQPAFATSKGVY